MGRLHEIQLIDPDNVIALVTSTKRQDIIACKKLPEVPIFIRCSLPGKKANGSSALWEKFINKRKLKV
jgi:hypothetical protein